MVISSIHPEDIKATIRKKFGSLAEFERVRGLKKESVRDVLRGKARASTAMQIAVEMGMEVQVLFPVRESRKRDNTGSRACAHPQKTGGARVNG